MPKLKEEDVFAKSGERFIEAYTSSKMASPIPFPENKPDRKMPLPINFIPAILIGKNGKTGSTYSKLKQASGRYKSLYDAIHKLTGLKCFTYYYNENGEMKIENETKLVSN